ncbi:copper homeostasis protein CutC [Shimwellia pseudoproteus]|uniref:copper homeostasis protein CutC n=1 Tax=Shimwellia pseudoproteus TaxID=570012 RepID=UPI0018EB388F|nr:copper homeostasis protein CutC [Shimwellia pseudoproteus]
MPLLEICCYGLDSALTAQQAGADRLELCSAPAEGGLTPSAGLLQAVRQQVTIPVHPIVRPRGGDFCYTGAEFQTMLADVAWLRDLGFPGLVVGVLDEDGQVDMARMAQIIAASNGMAVTFHRAFDMCADPFYALEQLTDLGVARILTSGQQASAVQGVSLLRELNACSRAPIIMAGAGVRPDNVRLFREAGLQEVHSSAGHQVNSPMRYRKAGVSMSSGPGNDEYSRYCVSAKTVAALKNALAG